MVWWSPPSCDIVKVSGGRSDEHCIWRILTALSLLAMITLSNLMEEENEGENKCITKTVHWPCLQFADTLSQWPLAVLQPKKWHHQCKVYGLNLNVWAGPGGETLMLLCSGPHNVEVIPEARKLFWRMLSASSFYSSDWTPSMSPISSSGNSSMVCALPFSLTSEWSGLG